VNIAIGSAALVGFAASLVRTTAWISICPPFNAPWVPKRIRVGLATAVSFATAHRLSGLADGSSGEFVVALLWQALAGLALGFAVNLLFTAVQLAGDLNDSQVGFSMGAVLDPLSGASSSPFGRLHQMLALVFLFVTNGHTRIMAAYVRSLDAVPTGHFDLGVLASELTSLLGALFIAALEIGFPVLTALMCAEVALGLLGKAAPQLNVMVIGFATKATVAISMVTISLVLLPDSSNSLLDAAMRAAARAFG
jgi:flagellar biosynthetic protein FliR